MLSLKNPTVGQAAGAGTGAGQACGSSPYTLSNKGLDSVNVLIGSSGMNSVPSTYKPFILNLILNKAKQNMLI